MTARKLFDDELPKFPIRLFPGDDDGSDTRITYPGVGAQDGPKADLLSIYAGVAADHKADQPTLGQADIAQARETWSLATFYDNVLAGWRRRQLGRGEVEAGTLQKERQSLGCFDTWDQKQQPDNWPGGQIWRGLPCGFLQAHYFERWATDRLEGVGRPKPLAIATVESRWCQLRTVLNWAMRLGVMDQIVLPCLTPLLDKHQRKVISMDQSDFDDFSPTVYSDHELGAVYLALASESDLQTAWVLGANTGPRTGDLFGLRWQGNVRLKATPPHLFYEAEKTGKRHWVPLAPCVVAHLVRLAKSQNHLNPLEPEGLVFPRLTAGDSQDPEKSRAARARTARLKSALVAAGLQGHDYTKPIQILRATCNTRLNNHRPGKGLIVTHGKDADVSSQHYWNEREPLIEAVMTLPQPAAFLSIFPPPSA